MDWTETLGTLGNFLHKFHLKHFLSTASGNIWDLGGESRNVES